MEVPSLALWLAAWMAAVAVVVVVRSRTGPSGTGIVYAYLLSLGTIHWLSAFTYLLPWVTPYDPVVVEEGFVQSVLAVWAFAAGSLLLAPLLASTRPRAAPAAGPWPGDAWLPGLYIAVGVGCYVLLAVGGAGIPTVSGLLATGQQLLVVGLCILCWSAWSHGHWRRLAFLLALTLLLPLITIVNSGFMGYGTMAAVVVYVFAASFLRPRRKIVLPWLLIAYVGLSFYVSYMRDRTEIREVVWGRRPFLERVEQLADTFSRFEWFDPTNPAHLWYVDRRLNQNVFVGVAASQFRYRSGPTHAMGDTLVEALLAMVPRALWPGKPAVAGSGDLVSRYTGFRFAEGTSVGIGQVLEFYVNFGSLGVALGFVAVGAALTLIDQAARRRLELGDGPGFALRFLVGIAFLQAGGSLVEIAGTAVASLAVVLAVNRLYRDVWRPAAPGRRARRRAGAAA